MDEIEVFCAIVGKEYVIPVKILPAATVYDLQKAIANKEGLHIAPVQMTLYLAKDKEDAEWLKINSSLKVILRGFVGNDYVKLRPLWKLDDVRCFGPQFVPNNQSVHVLVEIVAQMGMKSHVTPTMLPTRSVGIDVNPRDLWCFSELHFTAYPPPHEIMTFLRRQTAFQVQVWDGTVGAFAPEVRDVKCSNLSSWLEETREAMKHIIVNSWTPFLDLEKHLPQVDACD